MTVEPGKKAREPGQCPVCADPSDLAASLGRSDTDAPLFAWLAPGVATGALGGLSAALGATSWMLLSCAVAAGLVGGAVGLAISRRRAAERVRRIEAVLAAMKAHGDEHDALARTAADSNPDAIVLYDEQGTIEFANPAARELFFDGKRPEGRNFLRLLGEAPAALHEALLGETDRLFTIEVGSQSETHHVTRRAYVLGGRPHTLLVVKHLTREIARREVETLKKVVRVISHEVNNSLAPIVSLVGSARLIAERPEHLGKLSPVLDTIEERASHLHAFIEGYAGLARLPAPRPGHVDWSSVVAHLRALFPHARLADPEAPSAFFDQAQLEQVLINLLKNAVEAGGAAEDVELEIGSDADGFTRFEVRDRGAGFSDEALGSALLPFYSTKPQGSGLGLALCREIVEAHGGSLHVSNREGGGAVVCVLVPGKPKLDASVTRSRARLTLSTA